MEYQELLSTFPATFSGNLRGILLVGSGAWSAEKEMINDIDLEVILDDFRLLRAIKKNAFLSDEFSYAIYKFVNNYLDKVVNLEIPIFSLKIFPNNQEISVRFLTSSLFEYTCLLNLLQLKSTLSVFNFRSTITEPYDNQKNFSGGKINYKCWNFIDQFNGQLIEAPIAIVDQKGKFYPGQIIDRYLSFPKILHEKGHFCTDNINNLVSNVVQRMVLEKQLNIHTKKLCLDYCLCRGEKIPIELRLDLRKKGEQLEEKFFQSVK